MSQVWRALLVLVVFGAVLGGGYFWWSTYRSAPDQGAGSVSVNPPVTPGVPGLPPGTQDIPPGTGEPGLPGTQQSSSAAPDPREWRLVFVDDFNGNSLDPRAWNIIRSTPPEFGIHENDLMDTPEHVRVSGGTLQLRGKVAANGRMVTGLVETRGKRSWQNGRFEARIRVARGPGTTSSFWMMPDVPEFEPWPQQGEIDLMEQIGREPTQSHGTIHYPLEKQTRDHGTYRGTQTLSEDFHTYAAEWSESGFEWFLDGQPFHQTTAPSMARFPFNRPFFIILYLGIGGSWAGPVTSASPNPMVMEVDWVRVYQRTGTSTVSSR